jgi:hypothetical protein
MGNWMHESTLLNTLDDLWRRSMGDWMQMSTLLNTLDDLWRSSTGDWMQKTALLNPLDDLRRSCMGESHSSQSGVECRELKPRLVTVLSVWIIVGAFELFNWTAIYYKLTSKPVNPHSVCSPLVGVKNALNESVWVLEQDADIKTDRKICVMLHVAEWDWSPA